MAAPFVWGAGGAQMTPERIASERKVAEALMARGTDTSPVRHWSQGLNRVALALMGGFDSYRADEAEKANRAEDKAMLEGLLGGGAAPATGSTVQRTTSAPMGANVASQISTPPVSNKIYSNDEPSPLDPPSGAEMDAMVRMVNAEAGNQGPLGQQAVAEVIRNRAVAGTFGGDTPAGVISQPGQFEPAMTAAGRAKMAALDPTSPAYKSAAAAIDSAYRPETNVTGGATHFFAPKAQAALGRPVPSWGMVGGQDIGDHRFFGGAPQQPTQVAALAPDAPVSVPGIPTPTSPAAAPAPAAAPVQVAQAAGLQDINPGILRAITSPSASEGTKKIATILLQQKLQQDGVTTVDLGNAVGVMDKRGNIVRQIPKMRDPMEAESKSLDVQTKRKNLEAAPTVQRIKQPDGSEVAVQWDAQRKDWVPLKAPEGGNSVANPKLTEQQSKDVGFYNRGQKLLPRLVEQDNALTELPSAVGGAVSNYFKSDAYRQAEQTGKELLAVILRKDTGAAVTPSEFDMYNHIYLPRPGDDKKTMEQKRAARQTAIEGLRMGLGSAEIIFRSQEAAAAAKGTAKPGAAQPQPPAGVDVKVWGVMTPEERALWQ